MQLMIPLKLNKKINHFDYRHDNLVPSINKKNQIANSRKNTSKKKYFKEINLERIIGF